MKNEKETNCARKGFIGEWCGSDLEVMKRPRHSQHWSQDEVDDDGKDKWSCFNCDDVKKDLLFFLFRSKGMSIQATQNDGIDRWQIFPLHHSVLPENWRASSKAREINTTQDLLECTGMRLLVEIIIILKKEKWKMGIVRSIDKKKEKVKRFYQARQDERNQSRINLTGCFNQWLQIKHSWDDSRNHRKGKLRINKEVPDRSWIRLEDPGRRHNTFHIALFDSEVNLCG